VLYAERGCSPGEAAYFQEQCRGGIFGVAWTPDGRIVYSSTAAINHSNGKLIAYYYYDEQAEASSSFQWPAADCCLLHQARSEI